MKMKILMLCLIMVTISGCSSGGYDTPIMNDVDYPYVVTSIVKFNDKLARYYSKNNGHYTDIGVWGQDRCLIAPIGRYNIGDTILIK